MICICFWFDNFTSSHLHVRTHTHEFIFFLQRKKANITRTIPHGTFSHQSLDNKQLTKRTLLIRHIEYSHTVYLSMHKSFMSTHTHTHAHTHICIQSWARIYFLLYLLLLPAFIFSLHLIFIYLFFFTFSVCFYLYFSRIVTLFGCFFLSLLMMMNLWTEYAKHKHSCCVLDFFCFNAARMKIDDLPCSPVNMIERRKINNTIHTQWEEKIRNWYLRCARVWVCALCMNDIGRAYVKSKTGPWHQIRDGASVSLDAISNCLSLLLSIQR